MTMPLPPTLEVTDLAAEKAAALLKDKGFETGALRVFVVGGGCSGYQYGMALATEPEEGDKVIDHNGVRFLVDPRACPSCSGRALTTLTT